MIAAIREYLLPLGVILPEVSHEGVVGGYFIWIELPEPLQAKDIADEAAREDGENLVVAAGELFSVQKHQRHSTAAPWSRNLRLCFS